MRIAKLFSASAMLATMLLATSMAHATTVQVTITNNAMPGGVFLTPVWAGFHDGTFDSYDGCSGSNRYTHN